MSYIADPPDEKISLLKGILVELGGVAGAGDAPDTGTQILQAIVQTLGVSVLATADTQTELLQQWVDAVGEAYDPGANTEVSLLSILYIYYGGADDATLPDHEIPLLRFIYENIIPPSTVWILATGSWDDSGIWVDGDVWID